MARRMSFALALPLVACAALAAGCAEQEGAPPATAADAKKPIAKVEANDGSDASAKVTAAAPGHLARAEVERVLRQGPPWLLRRVLPEEVIRSGKFVGWRILSLPEDWNVDLQPGDIVTKVNGLAIERPDDLWAAWMQMQSAAELRVSIERDGKPRDLVLPIDGPSAAGAVSQQMEAEPPPAPRPSRWSTVTIDGSEAVPSDAGE